MTPAEYADLERRELERLLTVEFECKCTGIVLGLCDGCRKRVLAAEVRRLRAVIERAYQALLDGNDGDVPFILKPDDGGSDA